MAIDFKTLEESLRKQFGEDVLAWVSFRDQHCVHVKRENVLKVMAYLKDDAACKFEMLTDVTCIDNLKLPEDMEALAPERFAVVYQLTSLEHGSRLRVKAFVPEDPCEIDSVSAIWKSADWGEREAFDMFGVNFKGHPNLKRILMPDNYQGHPLRKDYPLKGRGERDNFPKYTDIPDK